MKSNNPKKKWNCPKCSSEKVKKIVYGYIDDPEMIKEGEVPEAAVLMKTAANGTV